MIVKFSDWLQSELNKRNWNQTELAKRIKAAGFNTSRSQITHILNEQRQASGDVCVAIAYALGVPPEEVLQARGWLRSKKEVVPASASPAATRLIRLLTRLPLEEQEAVSEAFEGQLRAMDRVSELRTSERPLMPVKRSLDEIQAELEEEFRTLLPDAYERVLKKLASEEAAAHLEQAGVAA